MTSLPTLLLAGEAGPALAVMRRALEREFDCLTAAGPDAALDLMEEHYVQAILCDRTVQGGDGLQVLSEARARWPEVVRVLVDEDGERCDAEALCDLRARPSRPSEIVMAARTATRLFQASRDRDRLTLEMRVRGKPTAGKLEARRRALREGVDFSQILRGPASPMNAIVELARQVASFDVPVLIAGEPGTGRETLARAMHAASLRSDQSFFALDCAGLPDEMLRVELLGARKGALAGCPNARIGLLQKAARGTLYLGGVETLSPQMQLLLLRVATEGRFEPLGGTETLSTDVRLMVGAPGDLAQSVAEGRFRRDLYYALAATELSLPPLRARKGDLEVLARHILCDLSSLHAKPVDGLSNLALEFLGNHDWPGNLPELVNELTRMLILSQERRLGPELISRHILQADPSVAAGSARPAPREADLIAGEGSLKDRVEAIEARILRETLTRLKWNKSRAAEELGLSRVGLRSKLERYGVRQPGKFAHIEEDCPMCLGIPGQITAITDPDRLMAMADVSGVRREVSVACIATDDLQELVGEWALIHVGFAMSVIDAGEAEKTLEALRGLGEAQETLEAMAEGDAALEGTQ